MEIYSVKLDKKMSLEQYNKLLDKLTKDEQSKISNYIRWEDAQSSLIGKILIKSAIQNKYNIEIEKIKLKNNQYGKPYYRGDINLYFNVSHSGEYIVCVTDNAPVGIDIEKICDDTLEVAEHFFSNDECIDIRRLDEADRLDYFYELWTLKESYIKNVGKGLTIPLDTFSISKINGNINISGIEQKYYFKQYNIDNSYKMAVCSTKQVFANQVKQIHLEDLDSLATVNKIV